MTKVLSAFLRMPAVIVPAFAARTSRLGTLIWPEPIRVTPVLVQGDGSVWFGRQLPKNGRTTQK